MLELRRGHHCVDARWRCALPLVSTHACEKPRSGAVTSSSVGRHQHSAALHYAGLRREEEEKKMRIRVLWLVGWLGFYASENCSWPLDLNERSRSAATASGRKQPGGVLLSQPRPKLRPRCRECERARRTKWATGWLLRVWAEGRQKQKRKKTGTRDAGPPAWSAWAATALLLGTHASGPFLARSAT